MSKSVVVTGSSGAIGLAIGAAFANAGYRVIGLDKVAGTTGALRTFYKLTSNALSLTTNTAASP